jgi:hypothetical protein
MGEIRSVTRSRSYGPTRWGWACLLKVLVNKKCGFVNVKTEDGEMNSHSHNDNGTRHKADKAESSSCIKLFLFKFYQTS